MASSPLPPSICPTTTAACTLPARSRARRVYKLNPLQPAAGDSLELFIDTRDVKEHRANRFCHRFYVLPGGSGKDGKQPIARQTSIEDAREQAPPCPEDSIETGLRRLKRSYQLEIKLPAAGLNGFAPREFSRVGFAYLLHDSQHGHPVLVVHLGHGRRARSEYLGHGRTGRLG